MTATDYRFVLRKEMMYFSPEGIFNYTDKSLCTVCRDRNNLVISLISKDTCILHALYFDALLQENTSYPENFSCLYALSDCKAQNVLSLYSFL